MITRLGALVFLLVVIGVLLILGVIPLEQPFQSLILASVFVAVGALSLLKTDKVISPIFASSRLNLWGLKAVGLFILLFGVAGLVRLGGEALGFW
jgi:hypothetical protein